MSAYLASALENVEIDAQLEELEKQVVAAVNAVDSPEINTAEKTRALAAAASERKASSDSVGERLIENALSLIEKLIEKRDKQVDAITAEVKMRVSRIEARISVLEEQRKQALSLADAAGKTLSALYEEMSVCTTKGHERAAAEQTNYNRMITAQRSVIATIQNEIMPKGE